MIHSWIDEPKHNSDQNLSLPTNSDTELVEHGSIIANENIHSITIYKHPENTKASALAETFMDKAESLLKQTAQLPPDLAKKITQKYELNENITNAAKLKRTIVNIFNVALSAIGLVEIIFDYSLGIKASHRGTIGADIALSAQRELINGFDYFTQQLLIRQLKKERNELNEHIKSKPESEELLSELQAKLSNVEGRIMYHKAAASQMGLELIILSTSTALDVIAKGLSFSSKATSKIAATSLGVVAGQIGLGMSIKGIVDASAGIKQTDKFINTLNAVNMRDKSTINNPVVNEVIDEAVNTAKRVALHQKVELGRGIFENAFTACNSALGIAAGAIAIAALSGLTISATAVAFTGIGLPVVGAIGFIISAGALAYTNRHTIARGLQTVFDPTTSNTERGRFSPTRNLTIRQWSVKRSLKNTESKMTKLSLERAKLLQQQKSLDQSEPSISMDIRIEDLSQKILKKADKHINLTSQSEEISYKKAMQNLRDKTTFLPFKSTSQRANDLVNSIDKISEDKLDSFATEFQKVFPGANFERLHSKQDKKQ